MDSGGFYSHVTKIAKRCQFPNAQAEERAFRDAIFLGMNSQKAKDKATNLMNEEGKVLTVLNSRDQVLAVLNWKELKQGK